MKKLRFNLVLLFTLLSILSVLADETPDKVETTGSEDFDVQYQTPATPKGAYLAETFDDPGLVDKTWVKSRAKKIDVDADIAKYDALWGLEPMVQEALEGDLGLVLKSKAKHAAIAAALKRPFVFKDKPLVVQYEVNLQNGQDCGGSYIKLLSQPTYGTIDLEKFQDKTPYTIMFGPDKCGNEHKFHFIFRHVNPLNGTVEEKHCKRPDAKIEEPFKDKKPHLYTLIIQPDSTFQILLDHEVINKGNLFEDFTPTINPPKEIDDPKDFKPADWDEREKIADPSSTKPEDWDEDEPLKVVDEHAEMPEGWLEKESKLIPDPEAEKPEDWDMEMDGEWEAPLITNPVCGTAAGCGPWTAPTIDNPKYKGKWKSPMIDNPNYKGKWSPRKIANPDFFEDLEPFKMTTIGGVGLELWSMSDDIYFDNILVTDDYSEAKEFAAQTFDLKILKITKGMKSYVRQIVDYSNENPWIYGVYVLLLAIPVVIVFVCCCSSSEDIKEESETDPKKTDAPTEDDPQPETESKSGDEEKEETPQAETEAPPQAEKEVPRTRSPRLRRARKE